MSNIEIELNPVDFITIGTIGPKGQRVFHLQAGKSNQLVSMIIEKEQAWALSEAISELVRDLDDRHPAESGPTEVDLSRLDMELREPIEPVFRVAQMGIGYDEANDLIVLIAQEMVTPDAEGDEDETIGVLSGDGGPEEEPSVVRMWCSRAQMRALSLHALGTVQSGRADPRQNGRLVYYWT